MMQPDKKHIFSIIIFLSLLVSVNFISAKQHSVATGKVQAVLQPQNDKVSFDVLQAQQLLKGLVDRDARLALLIKEAVAYGRMEKKTDDDIVEAINHILFDYARHGGPTWLAAIWKNIKLRNKYISHAVFTQVNDMHKETTNWLGAWKVSMKRSWWAFKSMMWVKQMAYVPHVVLAITTIGVAQKVFSAYKVLTWVMPLVGLA